MMSSEGLCLFRDVISRDGSPLWGHLQDEAPSAMSPPDSACSEITHAVRHLHCCCQVPARQGTPRVRDYPGGSPEKVPCPEVSSRGVLTGEAAPAERSLPQMTVRLWIVGSGPAPAEALPQCCDVITRDTACSGRPLLVMVSPEFLPCPTMTWLGHSFP